MKKKYFFFDIDATLTDDATHKIIPSAEWTLHELERNGHFVSIATGRAHYKTVAFTDPIGIRNLVCCGGACLVKHFYKVNKDRVVFVDDICAAAKGYEYMADLQLRAADNV